MLIETQDILNCMIEENKLVGARIDSSLAAAHLQVGLLRGQLASTRHTIDKMASSAGGTGQKMSVTVSAPTNGVDDLATALSQSNPLHRSHQAPTESNFGEKDGGPSSSSDCSSDSETDVGLLTRDQLLSVCLRVQRQRGSLRRRNRLLHAQLRQLASSGETERAERVRLAAKLKSCEAEIKLTKEALSALKADRKKLKLEKFDLLNQMRELYQTLEDKEKELRDFIRNYEQRIKEADEKMNTVTAGQEKTEREKWNILKHARGEAERSMGLSAELDSKEDQLKQVSEELYQLRKRLSRLGYCSDHELSSSALQPTYASVQRPGSGRDQEHQAANGLAEPSAAGGSLASYEGAAISGRQSDTFAIYERTAAAARRVSGDVSDSTTSGEGGHYATALNGGLSHSRSPALSPVASAMMHAPSCSAISKSAEQLDDMPPLSAKLRARVAFKQAAWGSISRVFAKHKPPKYFTKSKHNNMGYTSAAEVLARCDLPLSDELYSEKLQLLEQAQQLPMERWRASMVLAWLQVTLGMPQYGPACTGHVRSGKTMLEMSDSDLQRFLGIEHPMHRRKLRLAIEELRQPFLCKFPYISQLNHVWVSSEWLPHLGLVQYAEACAACLVDARMLANLSKKDMEKHLGLTKKFDQMSLMRGIQLLRMLHFDRRIINERRKRSDTEGVCDVLMWSNANFVSWVKSIDLSEYATNLKDSGIHGALVVLEPGFTADTMALALRLPLDKSVLRRHLTNELNKLLYAARIIVEEEAGYSRWHRTEDPGTRWDRSAEDSRGRQRPAATATLGRAFSRSYAGGLQSGFDKDKRNSSLRGSLSRALGLARLGHDQSGIDCSAATDAAAAASPLMPTTNTLSSGHSSPPERPHSVVTDLGADQAASATPAGTDCSQPRATHRHRRIKSISDMETMKASPV